MKFQVSNMPECHIMQGIPGSGKSLYASCLATARICSADAYFVGKDGIYRFDPTYLGKAHKSCMCRFLRRMWLEVDVCIDNTNTTLEEMVPYVRVAQAMGYQVHVHTFVCSVETSVARNTHNVPRTTIERMHKRLQYPPKSWDLSHTVHHTD